jgi:hypothetical protein
MLAQQLNVPLLDMAVIFAQMDGDPVCPSFLREQRCFHRIRDVDPSRLANRGDMIDIDT